MSGRDPWEGPSTRRPAPAGPPPGGLFSGPNLPFTVAIIICLGILAAFLVVVRPFSNSDTSAGETSTTAPGTTDATGSTDATTPTSATGSTDTGETSTTTPSDLAPLQGISLETLATGIPFPVGAFSIPGDDRIFVNERGGAIGVVVPGQGLVSTPYLDLTDRVGSGGIENGLLGLAFHPDFATNGRLFVYYTTNPGLNSRIVEFHASSPDAMTIDRSTEKLVLEVEQPGIRHRAGMLQFGPDGTFYVALGDGGLGNRNAQDLTVYQGSILRLDVDGGDPYSVPPDNPFASGGGLGEIYDYGFRNPWRFYIDAAENMLYIGDVGQSDYEEIDVVPLSPGGVNFGWPDYEGEHCYNPVSGTCDPSGVTMPVIEYTHANGDCSVTGGVVYRGTAMPELDGHYFYADWCTGKLMSFRWENGQVTDEQDWTPDIADVGTINISAIGTDSTGELLIVDSNGQLFRVLPVR
jgi:glucose/arabinose dehydrogenase